MLLNEMRQENQKLKIEVNEIEVEKRTVMRKLVQTMLKYEQETSLSVQAKLTQNISYQNDVDYITMPSARSKEKILMVATKEVMRESTRRHAQKSSMHTSFKFEGPTPTGASSVRERENYIETSSESSEMRFTEESPVKPGTINAPYEKQLDDTKSQSFPDLPKLKLS